MTQRGKDADRRSSPKTVFSRGLFAALVLLNLIIAGYFLAPQTVGNQIRNRLLEKFQAHYPDLEVRIRSGRVARDGVVVLEGIEFLLPPGSDPKATPGFDVKPAVGSSRPILAIGSLQVFTDMHLDRLLDGSSPIRPRKMIANDVVADLWRLADGQWSPQLLWPPLVMNDSCPRLEIRGGKLRIHRRFGGQARPLELDDIEVTLDVAEREVTVGDESVVGSPTLESLHGHFSVVAAGAFVDSLRFRGDIDAGKLSLAGTASGLRVDLNLLNRLPLGIGDRLSELRGLSALTDFDFDFTRPLGNSDPRSSDPVDAAGIESAPIRLAQRSSTAERLAEDEVVAGGLDFRCDCRIRDARFDHLQLPVPLEGVVAAVNITPAGIRLHDATARFGDASVRLTATRVGWDSAAEVSGRLIADGLMVNERLAKRLPDSLSEAWDEIRPRGPIDLDLRWSKSGSEWTSAGTAELRGVDAQLSNFPYPVAQLVGRIEFDDQSAWTDELRGWVAGQSLSVAFEQLLGGRVGKSWLQLAADGPIPIDSPLINALTPRGEPTSRLEQFVRSLQPSGSLHLVAARFDTDTAGIARKSLDLRISGGTLRYKEFPYPLYDVRGQITVLDDWVRIVGFQAGNSDNAKILCDGRFLGMPDGKPHPTDGDWQLALRFRARDLPLDETLRAALSNDARETWDGLSPTGVVDQAEVEVLHADSWSAPRVVVSATQHARPTIDNRTISLRPADIPYRIDLVEGALRFDGDEVLIHSVDGRHDSTRISADGRCSLTQSGQWLMDLNIHSGSRLHPDAELIGSLPAEVRGAFQKLQLKGPLSARGTVGMLLPNSRHPDATVNWDMVLQLEGNRIGDIGPVHDLRGEINIRGRRDSQSFVADGNVLIDSMHIHSYQLTQIRGPFGIHDDRLLLGEALVMLAADESADGPNRDPAFGGRPPAIHGNAFGGSVSLSGEVVLSDGSFDVLVAIDDADITSLLVQMGQPDGGMKGKAEGQARIEGVLGASHLLKGAGNAKLSQANLYQLPPLISVFNMLRVKPSEAVAFTDVTARFSLYDDSVTFNELKLWGDLIALDGSGTMNRSHEVDLSFNTRVSPHNVWSHVTRSLGDSRYTLWTLNVRGPLANPQVDRRALDAVGRQLEWLVPSDDKAEASWKPGDRLGELRQRLVR